MEETMMPELTEMKAVALFRALYAQSDCNFFGDYGRHLAAGY